MTGHSLINSLISSINNYISFVFYYLNIHIFFSLFKEFFLFIIPSILALDKDILFSLGISLSI